MLTHDQATNTAVALLDRLATVPGLRADAPGIQTAANHLRSVLPIRLAALDRPAAPKLGEFVTSWEFEWLGTAEVTYDVSAEHQARTEVSLVSVLVRGIDLLPALEKWQREELEERCRDEFDDKAGAGEIDRRAFERRAA